MEAQRLPDWGSRTMDWLGGMLVIFFYEYVCTALLVITINSTRGNAMAIGTCLFFLLLVAGPITGGHFNPAVSLGVFINKGFSWKNTLHLCNMWLAQFLGALVGMYWIYYAIDNDQMNNEARAAQFPHLQPKTNYYWQAWWLEALTTFFFVFSVLIVKDSRTGEWVHGGNGWLGCFVIASTLTSMIFISGGHTGASMNPAVSLAQHVLAVNVLEMPNFRDSFVTVYLLAPFIGGIAAGFYSWAHGYFIQRYAGGRQPEDDKLSPEEYEKVQRNSYGFQTKQNPVTA